MVKQMDSIKKLNEVLLALRKDQDRITGVIAILEKALKILVEQEEVVLLASSDYPKAAKAIESQQLKQSSYITLAVMALSIHAKPMNIKDLTFEVSKMKGRDVTRNSLEGTIFRHIKASKDAAKIIKVGPAFYGLPDWPRDTKSLWSDQVASA